MLYANKPVENYIRQYISKTVQEKLDDGQPREYLSEIRQCTILFINLVFDLKEQKRDYTIKLGNTLQSAFEIVDEELRRKGGQLNKLFMFDKGLIDTLTCRWARNISLISLRLFSKLIDLNDLRRVIFGRLESQFEILSAPAF